ncbi:Low-affinity inorganic phosphate transporter 1 [Gemmata obscuriglobus]|uniref:Phosphate transporter n=1 Tax=Gemmata obscuriglobus TaxID=114 RepID=A0A2Z3HEI1_9BACT|nr:inorganic phosphate transporter [Gemmata obscuriglobus]AWM41997.1 anion permease [Gemmata obscuriglobus]QEG32013.1 Low-affinity inorganic phosphate transporter 1 [Gemmata obscuriglobus]VTS11363.1 nuclease pin : Phosphate/sulfate permease OS=Singulisphaera acidiphila (strain ATCC BAA-1392 / DSM 18658 / VKM B-2454 / MOB10) GN=Sinac_7531 PE=4 SV=1: PHO4 [Gemmata obscuriglobus UQM 2246]
MDFWNAVGEMGGWPLVFLFVALLVAFAFEFINGFHDTANAVTTVIYTRTLSATPAVLYSGVMNFLGALLTVLAGGAAVAFSIVNLLPVDLLIDANSNAALVMVLALLFAGVMWNLGTWYLGLPVSSSHTLIGSILGVGMANSLWKGEGLRGVNWAKAGEVGAGLLLSPLFGFVVAAALLLVMRRTLKEPKLYEPPHDGDRPPRWVRVVLICTCGGVSFAHGSNDGQKGMGLLLLVLIGFMPVHYALNVNDPEKVPQLLHATNEVRAAYAKYEVPLPDALDRDLRYVAGHLDGLGSLNDLRTREEKDENGQPKNVRWEVRQSLFRTNREIKRAGADRGTPAEFRAELERVRKTRIAPTIEFVPVWVVVGTALALGIGTCVGYKRIVVTVAEKIGKTHLTYGQGAAAEAVAAATILAADMVKLPVSTTQVLSSGVAGTMVANGSGVQGGTCRKILLAWALTLPACMLLAGLLFTLGRLLVG